MGGKTNDLADKAKNLKLQIAFLDSLCIWACGKPCEIHHVSVKLTAANIKDVDTTQSVVMVGAPEMKFNLILLFLQRVCIRSIWRLKNVSLQVLGE